MAKIGFVCFLFLLLLLLLIIHIGIINEDADFPLPMAIGGEIEDSERESEEDPVKRVCFNPPLSDNPIFSLAAVASQDPSSPPNSSCTLPAIPPSLIASPCKDPAFSGQILQKPRRIIHVILFGFEVSILEIHMRTGGNAWLDVLLQDLLSRIK